MALWAIFIVGLVVRMALAVVWTEDPARIGGDAKVYWTMANDWVDFGGYSDPRYWSRPPGLPALLAVIFKTVGAHPLGVAFVLSVIGATSGIAVALIADFIAPGRRWFPLVAGLFHAVDPAQAWFARTYLIESVAVPLFLWFFWLCCRLTQRVSWKTITLIAVVGATVVHFRPDIVALVAGVPLLLLVTVRRARGSAVWFFIAVLSPVALCLPWSMYVTQVTNRPSFIIPLDRGTHGYSRWLTTVSLSSEEWTNAFWYFGRGLEAEDLPDGAYTSQDERKEVQGMVEAASEPDAPLVQLDRRFRELARRRIGARPFHYYLWLPLERAVRMWVHYEKVPGQSKALFWPFSPGIVLYSTWVFPYVVLAFMGFVLSWLSVVFPWNPGLTLLGAAVLLRTFSILGLGVLVGISLMEVRYLAPVGPLAVLLTLAWARNIWPGMSESRVTNASDGRGFFERQAHRKEGESSRS